MRDGGDPVGDLFYKDTVTIWNWQEANDLWSEGSWVPTVVSDARIVVSRGNNIMTSGNQEADTARLHIHDEWSSWTGDLKLEADGKAFFTAGDTSAEYGPVGSTGGQLTSPNFFETMKKAHPLCFMITSVDRFDLIPHWEVWGK